MFYSFENAIASPKREVGLSHDFMDSVEGFSPFP